MFLTGTLSYDVAAQEFFVSPVDGFSFVSTGSYVRKDHFCLFHFCF